MLKATSSITPRFDPALSQPRSDRSEVRASMHSGIWRLRHAAVGRARNSGVHPMAWWVWALGIAVATTRSPGIVSSMILVGALVVVVASCHEPSAFSRAFPAYLALAAGVVAIRVVFFVLVGIKSGSDVLLPLPRIPLPDWAAGIALLGPVTASGLLAAVSSGLALAALLLCFGAAVALTNPQRTLRSLPASLHLLGTSAVIAMTVAPQLVQSWQRVRRAQALRGRTLRGWRAVAATTVPVLQDALERSIGLAASMDSRGYARVDRGSSRLVLGLMLCALLGSAIGTYALLDGTAPRWLAVPMFVVGAAAALIGSIIASRRVVTTRYRPDSWTAVETLVAACGVAIAVLAVMVPPLSWPPLSLQPSSLQPLSGQPLSGQPFGLSLTFIVCGAMAVVPALMARPR